MLLLIVVKYSPRLL